MSSTAPVSPVAPPAAAPAPTLDDYQPPAATSPAAPPDMSSSASADDSGETVAAAPAAPSKPKGGKISKAVIGGLMALVVLVGGAAAMYLSQQSQDVRQQAWDGDTGINGTYVKGVYQIIPTSNGCVLEGWVCDKDNYVDSTNPAAKQIEIHTYADGNYSSGTKLTTLAATGTWDGAESRAHCTMDGVSTTPQKFSVNISPLIANQSFTKVFVHALDLKNTNGVVENSGKAPLLNPNDRDSTTEDPPENGLVIPAGCRVTPTPTPAPPSDITLVCSNPAIAYSEDGVSYTQVSPKSGNTFEVPANTYIRYQVNNFGPAPIFGVGLRYTYDHSSITDGNVSDGFQSGDPGTHSLWCGRAGIPGLSNVPCVTYDKVPHEAGQVYFLTNLRAHSASDTYWLRNTGDWVKAIGKDLNNIAVEPYPGVTNCTTSGSNECKSLMAGCQAIVNILPPTDPDPPTTLYYNGGDGCTTRKSFTDAKAANNGQPPFAELTACLEASSLGYCTLNPTIFEGMNHATVRLNGLLDKYEGGNYSVGGTVYANINPDANNGQQIQTAQIEIIKTYCKDTLPNGSCNEENKETTVEHQDVTFTNGAAQLRDIVVAGKTCGSFNIQARVIKINNTTCNRPMQSVGATAIAICTNGLAGGGQNCGLPANWQNTCSNAAALACGYVEVNTTTNRAPAKGDQVQITCYAPENADTEIVVKRNNQTIQLSDTHTANTKSFTFSEAGTYTYACTVATTR